MNERILERVQKLMALGQSPNEAEAASALAKAHELMRDYNLSLSDVELKTTEITELIFEEGGRIRNWRKFLLQAVSVLNFCQLLILVETKRSAGHTAASHSQLKILGKEHNVASARHMAEYLFEALERLASRQAHSGRAERESFKTGVADRLCTRLAALAKEDQKPNSPAYGLVKNEQAAIQAHLADLKIKKMSFRHNVSDGNAYHSGRAAAESISLNAQLRGSFSKTRALEK